MPRTSLVELPGCPPLRALTFDVLGLVKVVEARENRKFPTVVERWGDPDASKCVLAASMLDHETNPLLAVARKNGLVEVINPVTGGVSAEIQVSQAGSSGHIPEDDLVKGLHLFRAERFPPFLVCSAKGDASIMSSETGARVACWKVCNSGKVICTSVDNCNSHALFGGNGVEVNIWDVEDRTRIWMAKPPRPNNVGLAAPTWFTAATFLGQDHRKLVAGTCDHQVRLYDTSAQRRSVISVDFRESPIMSVAADLDEHTVFVGTAIGDLASFDMRTGKLLGCFNGKSCGSIRSISRHPTLSLIASCGLDSYVRFWDSKTRKPLSAVYLKQHLVNIVFDASFIDEGVKNERGVDEKIPNKEDISEVSNTPPKKRVVIPGEAAGKKKSKKVKS